MSVFKHTQRLKVVICSCVYVCNDKMSDNEGFCPLFSLCTHGSPPPNRNILVQQLSAMNFSVFASWSLVISMFVNHEHKLYVYNVSTALRWTDPQESFGPIIQTTADCFSTFFLSKAYWSSVYGPLLTLLNPLQSFVPNAHSRVGRGISNVMVITVTELSEEIVINLGLLISKHQHVQQWSYHDLSLGHRYDTMVMISINQASIFIFRKPPCSYVIYWKLALLFP